MSQDPRRAPEPIRALLLCVGAYALCMALALPFYHSLPGGLHLIDESGPVQTLSWIFWAMAGIGGLIAAWRDRAHRADWCALAFLMFYLVLREMDFQKAFTSWNLAHIPSYFDSRIPLGQRLVAFFFYRLPPPLAALYLLTRWGRVWLRATLARERWALGLIAWFALGIACAFIDKLPHFIDEPDAQRWFTNCIEEFLEMFFALYGLLLVVWASRAVPAEDLPV